MPLRAGSIACFWSLTPHMTGPNHTDVRLHHNDILICSYCHAQSTPSPQSKVPILTILVCRCQHTLGGAQGLHCAVCTGRLEQSGAIIISQWHYVSQLFASLASSLRINNAVCARRRFGTSGARTAAVWRWGTRALRQWTSGGSTSCCASAKALAHRPSARGCEHSEHNEHNVIVLVMRTGLGTVRNTIFWSVERASCNHHLWRRHRVQYYSISHDPFPSTKRMSCINPVFSEDT